MTERSSVRELGELLDMFLFLLSVALIPIVIFDPVVWVLWALLGIISVLVVGRVILSVRWDRELTGKR